MCISLDLNGSKIHAIYLVEFLKRVAWWHDAMQEMQQTKQITRRNSEHLKVFWSVRLGALHSVAFPFGWLLPGLTPWNVHVSSRSLSGICSLLITMGEIKFRPAPPSTSILFTLRLRIVGETNNDKYPTAVVRSGWSLVSKTMGVRDHFRGFWASNDGSAATTSRAHYFS